MLTYVNVLLTVPVLLVFFWLFAYRRHFFVRPSLQILICYHVLGQWSMIFLSPELEEWLPSVAELAILVHGFVWMGLAAVLLTPMRSSRELWRRITEIEASRVSASLLVDLRTLIFVVLSLAVIYLAYVPLTETGFFVLIADPIALPTAREFSAKLLDSPLPKYALSTITGTVSPLVTAIIVYRLYLEKRPRNLVRGAGWVALMLFVWVLAALSGAKGTIVTNVIVVFLVLAFAKRLRGFGRIGLLFLVLSLVPALAVTTTFSVANIGLEQVSLGDQVATILERAFVVPFQMGTWFVHNAQTTDFVGVAGYPRLAWLLGVEPINMPNFIGLTYGPELYGREDDLGSISANAGFIYATYAYFGMWALGLNVIFLLGADIAVPLARFVDSRLLVPLLAVEAKCALAFAESDFFTVWVTHGFGLVIVAAVALTMLHKQRGKRRARMVRQRRGAGRLLPDAAARPQFPRPLEPAGPASGAPG